MLLKRILRLEFDISIRCCVRKLKDIVWPEKSESFERIRTSLQSSEGKVSAFCLTALIDIR
jgi:hypothetical protein